MSEAEAKVNKLVDDAITKIMTDVPSASLPSGFKERLRNILENMAFRAAVAGLPETCSKCDKKIDQRLRNRCPEHIGMLLGTDFLWKQVRERGPVLATKAISLAPDLVAKLPPELLGRLFTAMSSAGAEEIVDTEAEQK